MGRKKSKLVGVYHGRKKLYGLDAITANILDGYKISEELEQKKNRMFTVQAHFSEGYNLNECAKFAAQEFAVSMPQAYLIVRETVQVFGDINKTSKEVYRHLLSERMMTIMREAKENDDPMLELEAAKLLAKINQLDVPEKGNAAAGIIPQLPQAVVLSTNPSILTLQAEDAEFTEE